MRVLTQIMTMLSLSFVIACSGINVQQDYDPATEFGALITYAWQHDKQPKVGDVRVDNSLLNDRIRQAVSTSLVPRAYSETPNDRADFLIAYHYTIRIKVENEGVNTSIGIGTGSAGSFGGIALGFGNRNKAYEVGELIIDVLDPKTEKILWRGTANRVLYYESNPSKTTQQVNETVAAILKKFPPRR